MDKATDMIFQKTWQLILEGKKTQTRRPIKSGERPYPAFLPYFDQVWHRSYRLKWQVGKTYAVQTHRNAKGLFRIRITAIHRERLQDISGEDAIAEGFDPGNDIAVPFAQFHPGKKAKTRESEDPRRLLALENFREAWDELYDRKGLRWNDNPEVWVLTFEVDENSLVLARMENGRDADPR